MFPMYIHPYFMDLMFAFWSGSMFVGGFWCGRSTKPRVVENPYQ